MLACGKMLCAMGQVISSSQMGCCATEVRATVANRDVLADISGQWIDAVARLSQSRFWSIVLNCPNPTATPSRPVCAGKLVWNQPICIATRMNFLVVSDSASLWPVLWFWTRFWSYATNQLWRAMLRFSCRFLSY